MFSVAATLAATALYCTALPAAEPRASRNAPAAAASDSVDVFDGMKSGQIDVKFVPKNDQEATITIKNNTDKPLTVKLPEAFAGVPVLKQAFAQQGGGGGAFSQQGGGGGNQGVGGAAGGGGALGGGGAAFNIAPEKVTKFKVPLVCLDHGKAEPNPRIPYELRPIDSYVSDPAVEELLKVFNENHLSQRATQAAAWHLANHMSWDELAAKQIKHLVGPSEPYFSADEIRMAMRMTAEAEKRVESRPKKDSSAVATTAPKSASTDSN